MRTSAATETDAGPPRPDAEAPLLAGGYYDAWWCWAPVGATVIAGCVAIAAYELQHPLLPALAAAAGISIVAAAIAFTLQWRRRLHLSWSDEGFSVHRRTSTHEHTDRDVAALAVTRDYQHAIGRVVGERQLLTLWLGSRTARPLHLEVRGALGEPSPIGELVERLQDRLETTAAETLRSEGQLARQHWLLADGLVNATAAGRSAVVSTAEITAVDEGANDLRVWVNTNPLPAIRVSQAEQDVWLLGRLLKQAAGSPGDDGVPAAGGLGRVLHESRPRSAAVMATMLAGMSASVAVLAVVAAVLLRMLPLAVLGAGTGVGGILLASTARRLWRCVFRLHEGGISQRNLAGDHQLRFEDIDQFVFDARRQYSRGRYLGTLFTMVFASQEQPKQGILHTERCAFETDEIARVRDRVADEIAAAMVRTWVETGEFQWTRELWIRGDVLSWEPRGNWVRKASPKNIPLATIRDFDVNDGWFYLWLEENDRPVLKVKTAEPNFFPGLLVFEQLVEDGELVTGRVGRDQQEAKP